MRRSSAVVVVIIALLLIGGAGYLGYRLSSTPDPQPVGKPVTVAVSRGDVRQVVVAPGQLIGTREVMLTLPASGVLSGLTAEPGKQVEAGEVLARLGNIKALELEAAQARIDLAEAEQALDDLYANAQMNQAQALLELEAARRALDELNAPELRQAQAVARVAEAEKAVRDAERIAQFTRSTAGQADIDAARAQVILAEDNLKKAEERFTPYANKPEDNLTRANLLADLAASRQVYEQAVRKYNAMTAAASEIEQNVADAELAAAQVSLSEAQRELQQVQAGPTTGQIMLVEAQLAAKQAGYESLRDGIPPDALTQAENRVSLASAELALLEDKLADAELRAPFDGIVLEVLAREGESILAGQSLILLADPSALEVRVTVIEEDLPLVEIGQTAELFFDAQPEEIATGHVARIVPDRVAGEDRPLYYVFLSLDQPVEKVVSGMTVDSAIVVAQALDVLRLPRAVVRAGSEDNARIQVWDNGEVVDIMVKVGLRGDIFVEILEGVDLGDEVVGE
jgi:HlyD family secretion protein